MNTNESEGSRPSERLVIRGANVVEPPLFVTTKAKFVEFYDDTGELVALLINGVLAKGMWLFANKLDDDWSAVLVRFGYRRVSREELDTLMKGDEQHAGN